MTGRWADGPDDGPERKWPVGVAAGQLELTGRRGRRRAWQIGRFELTCSLALTLTAGQATSSLARHLLVTLYADGSLPLWPVIFYWPYMPTGRFLSGPSSFSDPICRRVASSLARHLLVRPLTVVTDRHRDRQATECRGMRRNSLHQHLPLRAVTSSACVQPATAVQYTVGDTCLFTSHAAHTIPVVHVCHHLDF